MFFEIFTVNDKCCEHLWYLVDHKCFINNGTYTNRSIQLRLLFYPPGWWGAQIQLKQPFLEQRVA